MVGVQVTFRYDAGFDPAVPRAIAATAQKQFDGMPGLRSKTFTIDEESHQAVNFYVWESDEAARAFFTDELRERITGFYGVAPTIQFLDVVALVDNS
jgi:heme-degrading monooxygenase HmoA